MKMQFSLPKQNFPNLLFSLQWFVLLKIDSWWHEHYIILKLFSDSECLPLWNFWVRFVGQMEQIISSFKNGSKYDAVPFVKNDPDELSRLGQLVPRFTKSSTVGERMAQVRFLEMVQLIPVISVEMKKEEYLWRHSFYCRKFSPAWTVLFDISSEQNKKVSQYEW